MSVAEKIMKALSTFGDPVENMVYQGTAPRYYTFNISTSGMFFANNAPQFERNLIQVHLFAPLKGNVSSRIRETKHVLRKAGFTWPETVDCSDENGRHIVFECEIEGEL